MIALECCITSIVAVSFWFIGQYQTYAQENANQNEIGITFQKVSEIYMESVGRPWWRVVLVLRPEQYSKENLERIFQYYKEKYPDKRQALTVNVFAGIESFNRFQQDPPLIGTVFSDTVPEPVTKENWNSHHASYLRACDN